MPKFLMFFFLCTLSLRAFDSVEVHNPLITLHKSGYFKTDKNLTPQQALEVTKTKELKQLPQKAKSFGFDTDTYWYMFELNTASGDNHLFLDLKDIISEHVELFVFKNDTLVRSEKNGYTVPIEQRPIKIFPIRFELENNPDRTTYLLKINSQYPRYSAFEFGNQMGVDTSWNIQHFIYVFSFGVFFSLVLYNAFLYFTIKDKAYLWYCVYMTGLFALISVAQGYISLVSYFFAQNSALMLALFLQVELVGMTLFTEHFLNLKNTDEHFRRRLRILLYINIVASFLVPLGQGIQVVSIISMLLLFGFFIYIGIKTFINKHKLAIYYLLATGVGICTFCTFALMHQGIGLSYSLFSVNLMTIGMVWDLIFLSFALAYRIKLLREEKEHAHALITENAKFTTIGETIGNIAHQWRQPLTELTGYINHINLLIQNTKDPYKEELQQSIDVSESIIKHISSTIDTFQNFFHKNNEESFELISCIEETLLFMQGELKNNAIGINFIPINKIVVHGCKDEFFQVLTIIINNAKDALIDNTPHNRIINIHIQNEVAGVIVRIEDNGGGIKTDNINDIFNPYVSTKKLQGMGIGLYTAKKIIEQHMHGVLRAKNTTFGAIFEIRLKAHSLTDPGMKS